GARWGAPASLLDERPEEVSPLEAVEDILKLQLATYTPSDDPLAVYFKIHIERKGADALPVPVLPKDVLLMQDCSESMTQAKLDACKMGLHAWLDRLRPDDRFELVGFREDTHRCFGAWTNLV
ncbi:MAG: hypothetical protein GWO24_35965, partial [Akkermansiaceae bacterium]|nr:hypothetical protein [Akkermansiaceae bacterium]